MAMRQWTAYATDVPGDGACLFHAIGWRHGISGITLRDAVVDFIFKNPDAMLHDQPLRSWIEWDGGGTPEAYARRLRRGQWGGALETTILASMLRVPIFVYEPKGGLCTRVSEARPDARLPKIRVAVQLPFICVLWRGKNHYLSLRATNINAKA